MSTNPIPSIPRDMLQYLIQDNDWAVLSYWIEGLVAHRHRGLVIHTRVGTVVGFDPRNVKELRREGQIIYSTSPFHLLNQYRGTNEH